MAQKTAVEWLFEELNIWQTIADEDTNATLDTVRKLLEQAKQMEKEQLIKAYCFGQIVENERDYIGMNEETNAEIYYKKTYRN